MASLDYETGTLGVFISIGAVVILLLAADWLVGWVRDRWRRRKVIPYAEINHLKPGCFWSNEHD